MTKTFEYGTAQIKDVVVEKNESEHKGKRNALKKVRLQDRPLHTSSRFWTSMHHRYGFSDNIFRYFTPAEVFQRIHDLCPEDRFSYCIEKDETGDGKLLAVSSPHNAQIRHDDLQSLLNRYDAEEITYAEGYIRSTHSPRLQGAFAIAGDEFRNKFVIDTPIDGFGRPSVYVSLLRLVCSNGSIGYSPAFRSEVSVGKAADGVAFALVRVLDGFNNEEGFSAMRQRFESSSRSWASVHEVHKLYQTLIRLHHRGEVQGYKMIPTDGANEVPKSSPLLNAFHKLTGDLTQIYGLANLDALSIKRQRTLPAGCKVYDLLNFTSEIATHHATVAGNRTLQGYIGELISGEYDLEGTADHFSDWRDFFISDERAADTRAAMHRRSRS